MPVEPGAGEGSGITCRHALGRWTRRHWLALCLAAVFTLMIYSLNSRKYLAFQVRAADADRFSQAAWNTLQGRFLYTTITEDSILGSHFSPYMAVLAPLLLLWQDVRILYLFQILGIAAAGLILYQMVYERRHSLAIWFLMAFYLNPAVHQVSLIELRRVTLAIPYLALALYGLHSRRRGLLLAGILLALLTKENIGLIVLGMGLYILIRERDWKWGGGLMVGGGAWFASMLLWIIPAIGKGGYPQISYFANWGGSAAEIMIAIRSDPAAAWRVMFDRESLTALWQVLLPVGAALPFLGWDILIMAVPLTGMMLLSGTPEMHALGRWYMAPILPILFAAVGVGLSRVPEKAAGWLTGGLLAATAAGFLLYSPAPLGGRFEAGRYQYGERQSAAWQMVDAIPDDASVVAQNGFTMALALRRQLYLYPWQQIPDEAIEYLMLGKGFNAYPIPQDELQWEILNKITDPAYVVEMESHDVYLLHRGGEPPPAIAVDRTAEQAIRLEKVEVAAADDLGFFQPAAGGRLAAEPGQQIRVSLYWEAVAEPKGERTVSVRIADDSGMIIAQQDGQPAQASRPTSWWQPGWYLRDVYYLTIPPGSAPGSASLDVLLYDSYTAERIPFDGGAEVLHLLPVTLVE